jgi:hypothetical protein
MISALADDPLVSYMPEDPNGARPFVKITDAMLALRGDHKETAEALVGWGKTFLPESKELVWCAVTNGRMFLSSRGERPKIDKAVRWVVQKTLRSMTQTDLLFLSASSSPLAGFIKKIADSRDPYLNRSVLEELRYLSDPLLREVPKGESSVRACTLGTVSLNNLFSYAEMLPSFMERDASAWMRVYRGFYVDLKRELQNARDQTGLSLARMGLVRKQRGTDICLN